MYLCLGNIFDKSPVAHKRTEGQGFGPFCLVQTGVSLVPAKDKAKSGCTGTGGLMGNNLRLLLPGRKELCIVDEMDTVCGMDFGGVSC